MLISYDSEDLIKEAKLLMQAYGPDFEVYAIYSLRNINGEEYEYISDFVDVIVATILKLRLII